MANNNRVAGAEDDVEKEESMKELWQVPARLESAPAASSHYQVMVLGMWMKSQLIALDETKRNDIREGSRAESSKLEQVRLFLYPQYPCGIHAAKQDAYEFALLRDLGALVESPQI